MLTWRIAGTLLRSGHTRAVAPVELCELRYGFLPTRFRQNGEIYRVVRIEQIWEQPGGLFRADQRCFALCCVNDLRCTLVQELQTGSWQVFW
jgi:hypothetical protein